MKYLSSDRIMAQSVAKLCSFMRSFSSRFQICIMTNIHWVAIENLCDSGEIWSYFTAILRRLVGSQIWQREVQERMKLQNQRPDHVMIRSEIKYLIRANGVGTIFLEVQSSSNRAKTHGSMSGAGKNPAKRERFRLLGGSQPGPGSRFQFQSGPKPGNPKAFPALSSYDKALEAEVVMWRCYQSQNWRRGFDSSGIHV